MKVSLERLFRVYDDENGFFYEIRPDTDGLDCVQVSYDEGDGQLQHLMTISPEIARLVASALSECADGIAAQGKSEGQAK